MFLRFQFPQKMGNRFFKNFATDRTPHFWLSKSPRPPIFGCPTKNGGFGPLHFTVSVPGLLLLPSTFISAAPIQSSTLFPASMPLIRNRKTQFLACKLRIEICICVCCLNHLSHKHDVHVTYIFLPIKYIRTSWACCGKEMCVCDVCNSLKHSTPGVYAKMPRNLRFVVYVLILCACCVSGVYVSRV